MAVENRCMKGAGRTEGQDCSKHEGCRKGCSNPFWAPKCMKSSRDTSSGCGNSTGCGQEKGYLLLPTGTLLELEWSGEWQPQH